LKIFSRTTLVSPTNVGPAFGAGLSVLAVPADIGARFAAVGDQQAERKRDAAQRALTYVQRTPVGIGRHERQSVRRIRERTQRKRFWFHDRDNRHE
jgi:hypothetical protein